MQVQVLGHLVACVEKAGFVEERVLAVPGAAFVLSSNWWRLVQARVHHDESTSS
jgi:hypothetical protein